MFTVATAASSAYFYPRPPRGGRRAECRAYYDRQMISIHALREEGDAVELTVEQHKPISIHALREEGDQRRGGCLFQLHGFLSTPSARRATVLDRGRPRVGGISIHALREEGDRVFSTASRSRLRFLSTPSARRATDFWTKEVPAWVISIHALREEGDVERIPPRLCELYFYPRPPRGGRPSWWRA